MSVFIQTVVHHSYTSIFYAEQTEPDWEYFKVSAHKKVAFEPDGLGRAELVIYVGTFSRILMSCALINIVHSTAEFLSHSMRFKRQAWRHRCLYDQRSYGRASHETRLLENIWKVG